MKKFVALELTATKEVPEDQEFDQEAIDAFRAAVAEALSAKGYTVDIYDVYSFTDQH